MDNPGSQVLVSACLLGHECRYDGRHNRDRGLEKLLAERGEQAVPFCPEQEGGLATPRPPAWIESRDARAVLAGSTRVVSAEGTDVTPGFVLGAEAARERCRRLGIRRAYLKERSPSCGVECTHVNGERVAGPGVTTALLALDCVEVIGVAGA